MEKLIQLFLLADLLKSSASLLEAVRGAIDVLMPKLSAQRFKSMIGQGFRRIPSASTISRSRFTVDVAFMIYYRTLLESMLAAGMVAYMLADSSPVAGREWPASNASPAAG